MGDVLILGCGPAGVFAAWAAERAGHNVQIVSKKRPSQMFGAQYLHKQIPDIEVENRKVWYRLIGTEDGYRSRVYGSRLIQTSVGLYQGPQEAWDIRKTYYKLYHYFADRIEHTPWIDGRTIDQAIPALVRQYEYVFSTIPQNVLCVRQHAHLFHSQKIWAFGDAPELGRVWENTCSPEEVICNGITDPSALSWYRISNIFGHTTVEWPWDKYPQGVSVAEVSKPISTNCDCHKPIIRLGRFGKWKKGVLSHEAFFEAEAIFNDGR